MKYKAKRTAGDILGGYAISFIMSGLFLGSFGLVIYLICKDCRGDYSADMILAALVDRGMAAIITGLLAVCACIILFSVLKPPARYRGTIQQTEELENGERLLHFHVPGKDKASVGSDYKVRVDAACDLTEGDDCIAWVKEMDWAVTRIQRTDETDGRAKNEAGSVSGFMGFLFGFLIVLFAGVGIGGAWGVFARRDTMPGWSVPLLMAIPLAFGAAAIITGLRMKKNFKKDNALETTQDATGYGMEAGVPAAPDSLHFVPASIAVNHKLPEISVLCGEELVCTIADCYNNNFQVVLPDGTVMAEIRRHLTDVSTFDVTAAGLHAFTVRRRLNVGIDTGNYEITGLDFTVEGTLSQMLLRTLDGTPAAYFTADAQNPAWFRMLAEPAAGGHLNRYMLLIAAVIELDAIVRYHNAALHV